METKRLKGNQEEMGRGRDEKRTSNVGVMSDLSYLYVPGMHGTVINMKGSRCGFACERESA